MAYYYGSGDNNYSGFKLSPLFRIYEEKVRQHTSFIDLKAVGGYMHSSVPYYDPHGVAGPDEIHIKQPYTFLGICVGMGYKWDLGKNVYIRYSVCLQINKRLLKNKITYQNRPYETGGGGILPGEPDWYLFGPGSILDLKLAIGLM